jgi:hypothetical protein
LTSLVLAIAHRATAQESDARTDKVLIWIAIHKDRMSFARTEAESQRLRDIASSNEILIGCREFKVEGAGGENSSRWSFVCSDAVFITAGGIQGRAAKLTYESAAKSLLLQNGVKLSYESSQEFEIARLTADEMLLSLKDSRLTINGGNGAFQCEVMWGQPKPGSTATAIPTLQGGYRPPSQQQSSPSATGGPILYGGYGTIAPPAPRSPSPPSSDRAN